MYKKNNLDKSKEIFNLPSIRDIFIVIGSFFLYVAFQTPIESFFTKNLVFPLLSPVKSSKLVDLGLVLLTLFLVYETYRRYGKTTPSKKITIAFTIITGVYLYYRITGSKWEFTPVSLLPRLRYMDIIPFAYYLHVLLYVKVERDEKKTTQKGFIEDIAIYNSKDDNLGYTNYASSIAQKVQETHPTQAFAIGINGKWGLGKTSFFNLIKSNLKREDFIEINFNPWNSHSPDAIIIDFFETFQQAVKPYNSTLARELYIYSGKLVAVQNNLLTQSIQFIADAVNGFEPIGTLREDINKALQKIDKKIVVYIDDLDRLDKKETIEVIRLIRNTANFRNTFFIVAYDRNYVVNAIKDHNSHNQEAYLEKIIQLEVTLPYFNNKILKEKLAEKLKERLPDLQDEIDKEISSNQSLEIWIENMRDATRLVNSMLISMEKLKGEVVFGNLLDVELLKLKYPSAYELLHKQRKQFLQHKSKSSDKNQLELKDVKSPSEHIDEKTIKSEFELYLQRNYETLSIPKKEISKISSLAHDIFQESRNIYYRRENRQTSIIYPSKFERYFAYGLLNGNLSEIEFSKARANDWASFKQKIVEWTNDKMETELIAKFQEIDTFDDREDFEKIIEGIFFLANLKTNNTRLFQSIKGIDYAIIGYDTKDLISKMYDEGGRISQKLYNSPSEYQRFIKRFFENASSPYLFESKLLHDIASSPLYEHLPLTQEEITPLSLSYLSNYMKHTNKLDAIVWHHYHNCKHTMWRPVSSGGQKGETVVPDEAKTLMKDFVMQVDLEGFIITVINIDDRSRYKNQYCLNSIIPIFFGNWNDFSMAIESLNINTSSYLPEFKSFVEKFADTNYSEYVPFEFKVIPVKNH